MILATWIVAGFAIVGVGLLLTRAVIRNSSDHPARFDAFWLGLGATVALAQLWHFWLPINTTFVVAVAGVGVLGIVSSRAWSDVIRLARRSPPALIAFAIGAIWLALMGLRPLEIYDAGLYHLQAVTWTTTYPTVPGLGNLHGRLGFYSSFFLLLGAFAQGPLVRDYYRAVVGLLMLVLLAQSSVSIVRVVRARGVCLRAPASDWLLTFMALPTLITIGANGISTTSTDLPLFPLQILIVYYMMRWIEIERTDRAAMMLAQALVLIGLSATIKLSGLAFAMACLALIPFMGSVRLLRSMPRGPLVLGIVGTCALFVGMFANSVVLSGYPFYPNTLFAAPVDWRVPEEVAQADGAGIALFAHQPPELTSVTLPRWDWLPVWLGTNWPILLSPVIGCAAGLVALAWTWKRGDNQPRRATLPLLSVYLAIAFWFFTAPSYRFVGALLWLGAAIPIAEVAAAHSARPAALASGLFVVLALIPPQADPLSVMLRAPVAAVRRGLSAVPVVQMTTFVTDSGLSVFVPEDTNQAWAGPIPSTPVPNRYLRLRCADNLGCGFVIDPVAYTR